MVTSSGHMKSRGEGQHPHNLESNKSRRSRPLVSYEDKDLSTPPRGMLTLHTDQQAMRQTLGVRKLGQVGGSER